jgi:hypothetical protein
MRGDGEHSGSTRTPGGGPRGAARVDAIRELIDEALAPTEPPEDRVPPLPVRRGDTCWRCRKVRESGPSGLCARCRRAVGRANSERH